MAEDREDYISKDSYMEMTLNQESNFTKKEREHFKREWLEAKTMGLINVL